MGTACAGSGLTNCAAQTPSVTTDANVTKALATRMPRYSIDLNKMLLRQIHARCAAAVTGVDGREQ
jgi:hypothetical protein